MWHAAIMSNPDVRAAVATPALLGECPLWAPEEGLLYWLDIEGRVLHRYDPTAGTNETRGMPGRPGAAALGPNPGELIIAMEHELVRFSWDDPASLQPIRALEAARTGNRLNDGRTDPAGRFVVGSMWADPAAGKATGTLYQVDDTDCHHLRTGVGCPNGLAFDAVRQRVYWTDTPTERIVVADYDAETGAWENERLFFDYTDDHRSGRRCSFGTRPRWVHSRLIASDRRSRRSGLHRSAVCGLNANEPSHTARLVP